MLLEKKNFTPDGPRPHENKSYVEGPMDTIIRYSAKGWGQHQTVGKEASR